MNREQAPHPLGRLLLRRHLFRVGPLAVPSYIAMLYLGCVLGTAAGAVMARARGLDETRFVIAVILLMIPALLGSRLWFVGEVWLHMRRLPRGFWRPWQGGASLNGGLLLAIPCSLLLLPWFQLSFWEFWDAASLTMLIGLVFTRLGCTLNGCCVGRATTGPLGLWLPDRQGRWRRRYPSQLMEAALGLVILSASLAFADRLSAPGMFFAFALGTFAAARLALEPLREQPVGGKASLPLYLGFAFLLAVSMAAILLLRAGAVGG